MGKWITRRKRYQLLVGIAAIIFGVCMLFGYAAAKSKSSGNTPNKPMSCNDREYYLVELGKYVFFDEKISEPKRMGCVTCHDPDTGGTGSVSGVNLHQVAITGANPHRVGNLKPPTNAYASFIASFHECNTGGIGPVFGLQDYCGGNFWNGRSEGNLDIYNTIFPGGATEPIGYEVFEGAADWLEPCYYKYLGPVADQALNPFPNDVEQNVPDGEYEELFGAEAVCKHVASAKYAELFEKAWKEPIDCENRVDLDFKRIAVALSAFQASPDLNSFSSKRDKALRAELACACYDSSLTVYSEQNCVDYRACYDSSSPKYNENECRALRENDDQPDCDDSIKYDNDYTNSPGKFPLVGFTDQENFGHDLAYGIESELNPDPDGDDGPLHQKNANCAVCHTDNPATDTGDELFQLYSADDYHNIGTPPNPEIPDTGVDPDLGIAGHVFVDDDSDGENDYPPGFFKTPTFRNVNKRKGEGFIKAYTHNGWFKSMESIVHFYNTAATTFTIGPKLHNVELCPPDIVTEKDALANNCWPAPANGGSAIPFIVGNLGLTADDEAAIVAYLRTLTDEHTATAPKPYKPEY